MKWRIPDIIGDKWGASMIKGKNNVSNKRSNRYLKRQEMRLNRALTNNEQLKPLRIFTSLVQYSWTYRTMWFNRIAKGWYYKYSISEVKGILAKLDRIIKKWNANITYHRVYISKGNGKVRPLGVPNLEDRIFSAMWTDLYYKILESLISDRQHGYRPNKSTRTAWDQVWENISPTSQVYEFDLKSFFNKINMDALERALEEAGLHNQLIEWIMWYHWNILVTPISQIKDEDE